MWKAEPQTIKDEWKQKADAVKAQHVRDHPNYQYQPRKPSEKKRRMTKVHARGLSQRPLASIADVAPLPAYQLISSSPPPSLQSLEESEMSIPTCQINTHNDLEETFRGFVVDHCADDSKATSPMLDVSQDRFAANYLSPEMSKLEAGLLEVENGLEALLQHDIDVWANQACTTGSESLASDRFSLFINDMHGSSACLNSVYGI